jgi:molecular chaperone GrpE
MAETAGGGPGKRIAQMAPSALDLALASQQLERELQDVLRAFLPLLDSLEKLCRDLSRQSPEAIVERAAAISLLAEVADESMAKVDLKPCGSAGEMVDYQGFEIVEAVPAPTVERGRVLEVVERGWTFQGQVLRRARVIVSAGTVEGAEKE